MTDPKPSDFGSRLHAAALLFAERPALSSAGKKLTYRELFETAAGVATALMTAGVQQGDCVGILAGRTSTAYIGILGAVLAGCCYVPLNHKFPVERNHQILRRSGAAALVIDDDCAKAQQAGLLTSDSLVVLTPESDKVSFSNARPRLAPSDMPSVPLETFTPRPAPDPDSPLYLLFTSGTTGAPKGVPISNANLSAYLAAIRAHVPIGPGDRVLQAVDLTFDLSVHDMMLTWLSGAELYSAPENGAILAPRLIAANELTACLIVPSAAARALDYGLVSSDAMPSLRFSLFAGEALPVSLADQWQRAAPNAKVFNLYGPTEATIHTSYYLYDPTRPPPTKIMPIGWPIGAQKLITFDIQNDELDQDVAAEILLTGPQLTMGYWKAPELDTERFVQRDGERWYRTGDLGRSDPAHGLLFAGRADRQIKVRGYRVELQEIEGALRETTGLGQVAVVGWPLVAEGASDGLVAYLVGEPAQKTDLRAALRAQLPAYMIPDQIYVVPALPLNANGKTDYRALTAMLEGDGPPSAPETAQPLY